MVPYHGCGGTGAKDITKHEDKADQQAWVKESWSNLFGKG